MGKEKLPIKFSVCLHPIDIFNVNVESKVLQNSFFSKMTGLKLEEKKSEI